MEILRRLDQRISSRLRDVCVNDRGVCEAEMLDMPTCDACNLVFLRKIVVTTTLAEHDWSEKPVDYSDTSLFSTFQQMRKENPNVSVVFIGVMETKTVDFRHAFLAYIPVYVYYIDFFFFFLRNAFLFNHLNRMVVNRKDYFSMQLDIRCQGVGTLFHSIAINPQVDSLSSGPMCR